MFNSEEQLCEQMMKEFILNVYMVCAANIWTECLICEQENIKLFRCVHSMNSFSESKKYQKKFACF